MTYNAWGLKIGPFSIAKDYQKRIYSLPSEIYQINPDIIFLQEIWKKSDRCYLISELKKRGWHYSFYKSDLHPSIKKLPWLGQIFLGNGLLIISKYPIDLEKTVVHSFSTHTAREEIFTRKGALYCEINVTGIGKVGCINTHLGSIDFFQKKFQYSEKQKRSHQKQIYELTQFIKNQQQSIPLFIGADLNISDHQNHLSWFPNPADEYIKFVTELNLTDSYRLLHPINQGTTYSNKNSYKKDSHGPEGRLDYLFHANIEKKLIPEFSEIIFNNPIKKNNEDFYLSDHFGILTQYKFKKE